MDEQVRYRPSYPLPINGRQRWNARVSYFGMPRCYISLLPSALQAVSQDIQNEQ